MLVSGEAVVIGIVVTETVALTVAIGTLVI
jgi:hypothetical protein